MFRRTGQVTICQTLATLCRAQFLLVNATWLIINRVHAAGHAKPGDFPEMESPGKRLLVLESFRNVLNASKNMKCMADSKEI